MNTRQRGGSAGEWLAAGAGLAAAAYATYSALSWARYGQPRAPTSDEEDGLLDRFMPQYDVVDRHSIRVAAPAGVTLAAARELDLFNLPLVRPIFKARAMILGATREIQRASRGILAETLALGWVVLAESPGREVVVGAVTKPWEADVTFRSVAPDRFAAFDEPDYVKIAWTLRADPVGPGLSIFRTETRALPTDAAARAKFRRYWSLVSPGIALIRWLSLHPLKRAAENRAQRYATPQGIVRAEGERRSTVAQPAEPATAPSLEPR